MNEDNGKECPIESLFRAFEDPEGFLEPGQKIDTAAAHLIHKGGLKALFAPGMSYKDFQEGRCCKHLLIVEHDSRARNALINALDGTAFEIRAASTLEDAYKVLESYGSDDRHFQYAYIGERFPRARSAEPQELADELCGRLAEHSPDIRVFSKADLSRQYNKVPEDAGARELSVLLVEHAENPDNA